MSIGFMQTQPRFSKIRFCQWLIHVSACFCLLSCRSESTTSENITWRCSYEGLTSSGRTLSAQWVASEHRCWWDGGGERRPKTAEKFGNCGASLFMKEPFFLETQFLERPSPMPSECNFSLQGDSISLSISPNNEMTVSFMNDEPHVVTCSVHTNTSQSHGGCSSGSASLQTRSVFKEGVDIFYVGTCSEGVEVRSTSYGDTFKTSDLDKHYWVYEKDDIIVQELRDKCLADGHSFEIALPAKNIDHFAGSCMQKIEGGLVAKIGHGSNVLECPDHFNIFRISTE